MKMLIMSLFFLVSFQSMAGTIKVQAANVTCAELKSTVANYREVIVVTRTIFNLKNETLVQSEYPHCQFYEMPMNMSFKTKDTKRCRVGYTCVNMNNDPRDPRFPRDPTYPIPLPPLP